MIYAQKMDLDFRNDSVVNICAGCLSVDRKLRLLKDETKKMFHGFLDPLKDFNTSTMLCWECMALINKIIKFKTQVREAADSLSNYLLFKDQIKPFSQLHSSDTECIDHETSQLTTEEVFTEAHRQPAMKQEDSLEYFIELAANAEDLKTEVTNSEHISDSVEHFSDSDDEPLSLKPRSNAEERPKKRRHKEEDKPHRKKRKEKRTGVVTNKKASRKLEQLNMGEGQVELVLLTWEELEEERQRALSNEAFTRLEYKCYDCILGFNHRVKLENHMKKHEKDFGTEECDVCKIRCKDARALEAHTRRHRVRWRCSVCLSAWSRAAVAADHFARSHGSAAPTHRCSVCDHIASTLGKLRVHMKAHGERQRCEICDKTFKDRSSLRTHLFIHKGEKEYACPRCHKLFLFKKAMEVHLVTHLESAHLYCHECDKTFKNRMSYYGHMKYNLKHIDPAKLKYECELCDKKFAKAVRLEEHTAAIHLKVTPFSCPVPGCEFACSSRPVLRTHTRMVHRNARHVRNHVCHTCGKAYTTKKSLEGHMRAHTGERPFRCALCPSTFGYEAALYNHSRLVHRRAKKNQSKQMTAPGASWEPTINTITLNIPGTASGDS